MSTITPIENAATNTKICTRCLGSGQYSFNLKDGTVCYGCGGLGRIAIAPKGQKKIKPTVDSKYKAMVGDILDINRILYRVEAITWMAFRVVGKNWMTQESQNQKMVLTRLVDEKTMYIYRGKANSDGTLIHPTEDMIGKNVE